MKVNVFTLNCWGIPFVSKDRKKRMLAIADYLSRGSHDIVCLQEVWDEKDFVLIKNAAFEALPFSHYFYSGVFGSGVCVLSKWPIEEVFFHAWALNGLPHMVHHGDWFGGKGVGFCRIKCEDVYIHAYSAHLHAEYSTEDIYLAHRVVQAFNTAEFIKMTSHNADLVILAGDLNTQPNDLAFRIICETGKLIDTCMSIKTRANENDETKVRRAAAQGTNERAGNTYTSSIEASHRPEGKRIDHILYNPGENCNVVVNNYELPLLDNVPGCPFSYSDHDAVAADLHVSKISSPIVNYQSKEYAITLGNAISICQDAMVNLRYSRYRYLIYAVCLLIILLCTVGMAEQSYVDIPRLLLVAVMFYFLFMATLWNCMERNGILEGMLAMEIIQRNLLLKFQK